MDFTCGGAAVFLDGSLTALGLGTEGLATAVLAGAAEGLEGLTAFAGLATLTPLAGAAFGLTTDGLALATGLAADLAFDGAGVTATPLVLTLTGTGLTGAFWEAAFASALGLTGVFFLTAATGLAALDAALAGAFLGVVTSCLLAV